MKLRCQTCLQEKDPSEFHISRTQPRGYQYKCKECVKNLKQGMTAEARERLDEIQRRSRRFRDYGMTQEDYEDQLERQHYQCGICKDDLDKFTGKELHVDHKHGTKSWRGILCGNCNRGIGNFKEDVERLREAIKWLENGGIR